MTLRSAGIGCLATLLACAAVAGCGSLGYEESLTYRSAQHQLAEAKRDPAVRQYGGVFLRDADETLKTARAARFDRAQSDHLAYLALRKVEIAQSIAGLQVASASLQSLAEKSLTRDSISPQLADRTLSADKQPPRGGSARSGAAGSQKVAALPVKTSVGDATKPKSASGPAQKKPAAAPVDGPMSAALENAIARKDPRSAVFAISGIETADDPPRLSSDAERSLTPLVSYLRDNRDSRIIVEGYTNDKGSHEDDLSGSLGVAEAVKTYLTGQGIDGGRIFTLGRGADAVTGNAAAPSRTGGRIEIGLFQGIAGPAPALTSKTGSPAPPEPFPLP